MKTTSTTKANQLDGRTAQPGRASRFASAPACSLSQVVWVVSNSVSGIRDHLVSLGVILLICALLFQRHSKMDASRDLAFLSELSQVPNGELAFYDYLCKSRYWTVEPRHKSIYAILNNNGEKQLFSRISASTIIVEFNHVPKEQAGKADLQKNDLAPITQQNQFALKDFRTIILSDNSKLIVNSHERHGTARHFKKQVVAYFKGVMHDVIANTINKRLLTENSIRYGYSSFGVGDVSVLCDTSPVIADNSICGWINFGERGFIYAILFDATSGKRIGINKAFMSRQYVGSDEDANKRFFFELPLFLDGDGEMVETRIVLCSSADNRSFFTTNAVLQTWVR